MGQGVSASKIEVQQPTPSNVPVLPSDLYGVILSFVPEKPRLLVMALVCKRWRTLVYATLNTYHCHLGPKVLQHLQPNHITSLDIPHSQTQQKALYAILASFSNLTTASLLPCNNPRLCVCTSLRKIDQPIESLSFTVGYYCPELKDIAGQWVTSLTHLSLDYTRQASLDIIFPRLRSLKIARSDYPHCTRQLLINHASQLHQLTVVSESVFKILISSLLTFPLVRSLKVAHVSPRADPSFMVKFPSVTCLKLTSAGSVLGENPALVPFLSRIEFFHEPHLDSRPLLFNASRICSLSFSSAGWPSLDLQVPFFLPIASRLCKLTLCGRNAQDCSPPLQHCTMLRRLVLINVLPQSPVTLYSLRHLHIINNHTPPRDLFAILENVFRFAPYLRTMNIEMSYCKPSLTSSFLMHADRAGLEDVIFNFRQPPKDTKQATQEMEKFLRQCKWIKGRVIFKE